MNFSTPGSHTTSGLCSIGTGRGCAEPPVTQRNHGASEGGPDRAGLAPVPVWHLIAVAVCLSGMFCVFLGLRLPIGVPGEWVLSYSPAPPWDAVAGVLPAFAVWGAVAYMGCRYAGRWGTVGRTAWTAAATAAFAIVCVASLFLNRYHVVEAHFAVISPNALGAYTTDAVSMEGPKSYLRTYHERMRRPAEETLTHHTMDNPPGMTLLLHAAFGLAERNRALMDWLRGRPELRPPPPFAGSVSGEDVSTRLALGIARTLAATTVILVLTSLAYVPVYLLACEISGMRTAPLVAGLALTVPNFHACHPGKDAMQFVFIASMWLCALKALRTRRPGWALAAGFFFFLGSFFIFMCVPAAGLIGVVVLLQACRGGHPFEWLRTHWRPWLPTVLWGVAGAVVPYLVLYGWSGYNPILAVLEGRRGLVRFFAENPRTYWAWVFVNMSDWVLMGGGDRGSTPRDRTLSPGCGRQERWLAVPRPLVLRSGSYRVAARCRGHPVE